ncbi:hypothetical protein QI003_11795 [Bacillus stercoris]|uniref:hypothetical protein n=1 Tax=Bacillus TaxID=1386 RepID=UPI00249B1FEA|nr:MULTISPECIES: hypothetical protein [Bacillus]MDN0190112.1 hypothetical protein [Bacillus sp. B.PNR1]MDN3033842.1 hypothetical protein [Bacillus sp. B.PNR2]WGV93874.1 hypothetical protein QI003_15225 [Bacillus stercoris]WGV97662.1 hypothetical protein QI003_11795 [Bacillus stercoris]
MAIHYVLTAYMATIEIEGDEKEDHDISDEKQSDWSGGCLFETVKEFKPPGCRSISAAKPDMRSRSTRKTVMPHDRRESESLRLNQGWQSWTAYSVLSEH